MPGFGVEGTVEYTDSGSQLKISPRRPSARVTKAAWCHDDAGRWPGEDSCIG